VLKSTKGRIAFHLCGAVNDLNGLKFKSFVRIYRLELSSFSLAGKSYRDKPRFFTFFDRPTCCLDKKSQGTTTASSQLQSASYFSHLRPSVSVTISYQNIINWY